MNAALMKDNLTFYLQTKDKTWRQARIQALKVYQVAKRIARETQESMGIIT